MASFDIAIPHILQWEGGLVNHPNDPGGLTNRGITLKTFIAYAQKVLGILPTETNLINLTIEQAKRLYYEIYWKAITGDLINNQYVANIYFDARVNMGTNAVRLMQSTLNEIGFRLVADGIHGPKTLAAINDANPAQLHDLYKRNRETYYRSISQTRPTLAVFLKGWLNRVESFPWLTQKKNG